MTRRRGRSLATLLAATLSAVVIGTTLGAAPVSAAAPRPAGLHASGTSTSALTLSWKPVSRAQSYDVEIATDDSFDDLVFSDDTVNTRVTPQRSLPNGRIYWRVRANLANRSSGWSTSGFGQGSRPGPSLLSPAPDADLAQPSDPPVLVWTATPGAEAYQVEVDTAGADGQPADWVDSRTITTETTSTVVNEPQPGGTYWWRVRAELDGKVLTAPSEARSYTIGQLRSVTPRPTRPSMEEVVLTWDPVPGAVSYEIRVSTDNGFNKIIDTEKNVAGTRYSPPETYDNASYWWQVRAKNALGQTAEWATYPRDTGEFRRDWDVRPELVYPADQSTPTGDLWFQWNPVRLASLYRLDVGTDPGFSSSRSFTSCSTTQTTFVPRGAINRRNLTDCLPTTPGTYYWRVFALDDPTGVHSLFSQVRSFTVTAPPAASGTLAQPTGQRLSLDGDGASPCRTALTSSAQTCQVSATPMLDWDPAPGASYYRIYLAHDPAMTNIVDGYGDSSKPDSLPATINTRWSPNVALPDTQAGEAYYWFVRACDSQDLCGLTPERASNAFQKKSAPVETLPVTDASDQITLSWRDYLETNQAVTDPSTSEHPGQAGRQYRVQVSTTASFANGLVDDLTVDQTTYTAFSKAYPEGPLWWRVQALDGSRNGLTWSEVRSFTKTSPVPTLIDPTDGTAVAGVQPFRWRPLDYAALYDIEVYRNNDRLASPANKAAWATNVRQSAFSFTKPLSALGQDFVWRVRRSDVSGNKSRWSDWGSFRVVAATPVLAKPSSGATVPASRSLFTWRATYGATRYAWQARRGSRVEFNLSTYETAYAPTSVLEKGKWSWRVISYDANGEAMRASSWRSFKVR